MVKYFQKLGKALFLPVSVLPICGILMGIGYTIAPAVMGVPGKPTEGVLYVLGFFLIKAGGAIINNVAVLFAAAVAFGMASDSDGTAAVAGLVAWLMVKNLLSPAVVCGVAPQLMVSETNQIAFKSAANPFIGIICGILGAFCYNRFRNVKLPGVMAFFGGRRLVPLVTGFLSVAVAAVLLFVWPMVFGVLVGIGNSIKGLGVVGVGLYTFLNRLLIPTGLHHALNNVFWFDTIGMGDMTAYWSALQQGSVMENGTVVNWSVGMYMSGFFPCIMFGIPGAALAMIQTAKTKRRKATIGIVGSAALCALLCGVTEPFEFAFMFLAFPLYVVYAALYGVFAAITVALGYRAGFCFSAGFIDSAFSAFLPASRKPWMLLVIGPIAFIVFYLVFLFAIKKFNLKTPGREEDTEKETQIELPGSSDCAAMAAVILEGLGGADNIDSADNCMTRLRIEVKDRCKVNEKKIKSSGCAGVVRPGECSVQVVIGPKVQFVAEELKRMIKANNGGADNAE